MACIHLGLDCVSVVSSEEVGYFERVGRLERRLGDRSMYSLEGLGQQMVRVCGKSVHFGLHRFSHEELYTKRY
jgi:hypothetical protein